jgi:hypothetical protein
LPPNLQESHGAQVSSARDEFAIANGGTLTLGRLRRLRTLRRPRESNPTANDQDQQSNYRSHRTPPLQFEKSALRSFEERKSNLALPAAGTARNDRKLNGLQRPCDEEQIIRMTSARPPAQYEMILR